MADEAIPFDPFARFRLATRARIGLGRSGDALPSRHLLSFQLAHALARDAVNGSVDWDGLTAGLPDGVETVAVHSAAPDRQTYLRRPDLGRRLEAESLGRLSHAGWDLALVVADGLSAAAVQAWAPATAIEILTRLKDWKVAPIVLARQARVALGDHVGERLGARMVAVLIGERPGLSVADSLGIYLTYAPRPGCRDAERNCISNIHADGLSPAQAAEKLVWLAREGMRRKLTGVGLKEETPSTSIAGKEVPAIPNDA
ncbi:ethanolamine ammonia-lyase subunit EutC [Telmatospirillum siberiense]|uniref:Ethanolamine ammonia-lyase small subunit n=1 Tax=Telmatospirillum siberiense TaxID=382514 RepID=A0A2N3PNS1_9PROT|nr:ethanolamine ammonia-lyase subunit EutC [Telmatospirillum siberiense]PKU22063.1 ethanolamine ammonia-lyase [Telmatospirillum siberiense]